MRRTTAAGVLLAVALAVVGTRPAPARAQAAAEPVLVVVPDGDALRDGTNAGFSVAAQAGGGVWQTAVVENRSAHLTLTVRLHGTRADGSAGDEAAWLMPSEESVRIEPRSSRSVEFTIAPPSGVAPGVEEVLLEALAVEATGPGSVPVDLPDPAPRATVTVRIEVLRGAPVRDVTGRTGAAAPPESGADGQPVGSATGRAPVPQEVHDDNTTFVLVLAILLVFTLIVSAQTLWRRRRTGPDTGAAPIVPNAPGGTGTTPAADSEQPPAPPRPESRMLVWQRRAAERRLALRREREREEWEARRQAAELWARAARSARERSEREAILRAKVRAELTAEGVELSTQLAEVQRAEEELRLAERRRAELGRKEEAERLARERAKEAARRLGTRHAAVRAAADAVRAAETRRRKEADLNRRAALGLRADLARRVATRPFESTLTATEPVAPLPFEGRIPDRFARATPPPPKPRPKRVLDLSESDDVGRRSTSDGEDSGASATVTRAGRRRRALAIGIGRPDVTALDVAALNERLSARAGEPRR